MQGSQTGTSKYDALVDSLDEDVADGVITSLENEGVEAGDHETVLEVARHVLSYLREDISQHDVLTRCKCMTEVTAETVRRGYCSCGRSVTIEIGGLIYE